MYDLYNMQVPRPELSRSKELYRIMYEVLVVRGGVEGLRHAVQMCRDAHENGEGLGKSRRPGPLYA